MSRRIARRMTMSLAVLAASAMPLTAAAGPAWAAESAGKNVSAEVGGAYGAFHHNGDRFQLWDKSCNDRRAVVLHVYGYGKVRHYWNKSCGTRWFHTFDPPEKTYIGIKVCVAYRGLDRCSERKWGRA
ncbi:hypothetical protein [Nonomuraea sp. KM90]|uniref:hypothetical protein n=1 Tax=Nonomuraea sp. KM90 TaxID=3457428 RepID=UPI003FCC9423